MFFLRNNPKRAVCTSIFIHVEVSQRHFTRQECNAMAYPCTYTHAIHQW